jgi:hypothetical protein
MRLAHRLRRLELTHVPPAPDGLTDEQRRRRVIELLRGAHERKLAVDVALASGNPRRRRWAEQTLAAADTPEMRAWLERERQRFPAVKAWLLGRAPCPG